MPLVPLADYLRGRRAGGPTAPSAPTPPAYLAVRGSGAVDPPPPGVGPYLGAGGIFDRNITVGSGAVGPTVPGAPARQPLRSVLGRAAQPDPFIPRDVGTGVGLARSLAPLFRQPGLTTGAQTVSDLFNLVGGGFDLSRARTPTAIAGGALRTVSGLSGLGRLAEIPGAGAASALTGLGGAGFSFARGNIPGGVHGLLSGAGTVANLFPATATLAGVPLSAAGGAAAGGLAAAEAGIGLGAGAPLTGASLAGAAGALGIPFLIGKVAETLVNLGLGEGMFGQTKLPFGRGNQFSSADNLASQLSKFASIQGENQVRQAIQQATDPRELLALAIGGPGLSAHGEIQFTHPEFGFGGDRDDPQAETYVAAVQQIARTGDPDLLRRFIGGIQIQTGESGVPAPNYLLTDWYRRKLVSLLPETHPVRQNPAGLSEPTPARYLPEARAQDYLQTIAQLNEQYAPAGGPVYTAADAIRGLMAGNVGHESIATLFRPESELIDRATAERMVSAFPGFSQPPSAAFFEPVWVGGFINQWATSAEELARLNAQAASIPSLQSGGYVPAPPGVPVPATVHGGEYVVPAGPLAEWLNSPTADPDLLDAWLRFRHGEGREGSWDRLEFPPQIDVPPANVMRDIMSGYEAVRRGPRRQGVTVEEENEIGEEENEIGAHRAAAGRGAGRVPLRDYFLARATGQGDFNGAPWPEALRPGPPTPEEMRRREPTPPMRDLPGSRPMTPDERRRIQWPPSVAQLI